MTFSAQSIDPCGAAIAKLEVDIHDEAAERRWRAAVREGLLELRETLTPHHYTAAGAEQLFHDAPRLARAVTRIGSEREQLTSRAEALLALCADLSAATLAASVRQLLGEVRAHRRRVADLLHEAYTVDIGGEM